MLCALSSLRSLTNCATIPKIGRSSLAGFRVTVVGVIDVFRKSMILPCPCYKDAMIHHDSCFQARLPTSVALCALTRIDS
jgi:hypothetical protein